jgi:hypothetical protein
VSYTAATAQTDALTVLGDGTNRAAGDGRATVQVGDATWGVVVTGGTLDAIGFAFGAAMQRELQALRANPVAPRPVRETSVVTTPPAPGCPVPVLAGATAVALHEPFAWTSEEAINTALVPADLVAALRREACAVR